MDVLRRERESHVELAQLGNHARDRERGEVLELVNVEEVVSPLFLLHFCAAERSKSKRRHEKSAEEMRAVFSEFSHREIDDQDSLAIHDLAKAQLVRSFDKEAVEPRIGK